MMCFGVCTSMVPGPQESQQGWDEFCISKKSAKKTPSCFAKIQTLLDSEKPQSRNRPQEKKPFLGSPNL